MPSSQRRAVTVRPMQAADRAAVADIVAQVGNFNQAEIECALDLVNVYLDDQDQKDYTLIVAEDEHGVVEGYACLGPTPLTRGTYDLYWIATHPRSQRLGIGQALMEEVELQVRRAQGRLLVVETSTKGSYGDTVRFYRNLGYEETSRIRDFYDVGDDKLVFVKRLSR